MKFILIILFWLSLFIKVQGREMKILSFTQEITKLNAVKNPRIDYNGNNCAVVIVQIPLEDVYFAGNIIGEVLNNISEYEVDMSAGSQFMVVSHNKFSPLEIDFSLFGIQRLESKCTYVLRISALEEAYNINTIYEEQFTGTNNSHKYVDLGLSVLWSVTNLGANSPEGKGDLYAWGEIKSKKSFGYSNYIFKKAKNPDDYFDYYEDYTKYNKYDRIFKILPEDDAANASWGSEWRIPTAKDYIELLSNCSISYSLYRGVRGFIITGPTGQSIFLPAADYWLSTFGLDDPDGFINTYIDASKREMNLSKKQEREDGLYVRPVISKK